MADTTIPENALNAFVETLDKANIRVAELFPGDSPARQPVHTVYGGAHLFAADTVTKLGALALRALTDHAPNPPALAECFALDGTLAECIYPKVVDKLSSEPVEDLRIDFEDGFGHRPDHEEDGHALRAANEVARAMSDGVLPPAIGIRIKPLNEELKRRSLRTFDLFLTRLLDQTGGTLPPNFVVTLPKITAPEQVAALTSACEAFEYWRQLPAGSLRFEVMVETTQAIISADGTIALPRFIAEGGGRITTAHFGTYDYTAACNITAAHQHMLHPACDFARHVMQVALAGSGIHLSDGATNVMPIGSPDLVRQAWRLHFDHVRHSLTSGFYQGWDLHPAQLPSRYVAVYAFFRDGLDAASDRLQNFVSKAAQATMVGHVFDDAATGQGLLNYFLRAMNCRAVSEDEAVAKSGLTLQELRSRSFVKILQNRSRS